METYRTKVQDGGRVVIPAAVRKAMKLKIGAEVMLSVEKHGLTMFTRRQALERLRVILRKHEKNGRSLAKELIAERRREAAREIAE